MNYLLNNIQGWVQSGPMGNDLMTITGGSGGVAGTGTATITDDLIIPELWSSAIFGYFEASLILRGLCDDYSALVKGRGDTINIPELPEATGLLAKTEGTAVVFGQEALVDTNLSIDKHKYVAKMFEDLGVIQANESLFSKYAQAIGYQLAKQVDTDIITELSALGTTQTLDDDNILAAADGENAVATLLENNLNPNDCVWLVNSKMYADLLSQGLIMYRSGGSALGMNFDAPGMSNAQVPSFFGMPVMTTSLFGSALGTGNEVGYCIKRGAVALAVQQDIRVQSEYSVDFLATKVVADCIYGVKRMSTNKVMGIELLNP